MKLLAILASGVSLTALLVCARLVDATLRPPPAYFISLPGGVLLCGESVLSPGFKMWSCSTVAGSLPPGERQRTEDFSASTLERLNSAWLNPKEIVDGISPVSRE